MRDINDIYMNTLVPMVVEQSAKVNVPMTFFKTF